MKPSPLLLETIKVEDGEIYNLPYHQKRFEESRQALFGINKNMDLSAYMTDRPARGLYRCRIIYNKEIHTIEYFPYIPKKISSLKIVPADIDYAYKYVCRDTFNTLLKENSEVDEIIIEKGGLLTDTTISNIAFYDGETWFTPKTPLLKGTMRAKLIEKHFLKTRDIAKEELSGYTQVALINAMIGFKILNHFKIQT